MLSGVEAAVMSRMKAKLSLAGVRGIVMGTTSYGGMMPVIKWLQLRLWLSLMKIR